MIRNLILTAWRGLVKNSSATIINLTGLVCGFCCVLVIGVYLHHEVTYDQYHVNANRIFRITHNEKAGEIPGIRHLATVGPPVGLALKQEFTSVEETVRFRHSTDRILRVNDRQFYESRLYYVDPSVFQVFTFPLISGNAATALSLPNNIVLTEAMAKKYFGEQDPIGKIIQIDNQEEAKVTGVLKNLPSNSHLQFDFLMPFEAFKVPYGFPVNLSTWGWISFHTYVMLKPGFTEADLENQLPNLVKAHWPEERAKKFKMQLQPLIDIYFGDVAHDQVAAGNKTYLWVLGIAGGLILLIASFNFANLFTALSLTRTKEVGVRKVLGAPQKNISLQIVAEAVFISLAAALLALALAPVALRYLSEFGININMVATDYAVATVLLVLLAMLIGIIAGLYPSTFLSALHHHALLKGSLRTSSTGIAIRRGLLFLQFCITIALLSSVVVIDQQLKFISSKNLGYAKDELLLLRMPGDVLATRFQSLRTLLLRNPMIKEVAMGGGRMDGDNGNVPIYVGGNMEENIPMAIDAAPMNYFKTIGVDLLTGKEFSEINAADTSRGVLLNEAAAKVFGWNPEEALGKKIRVGDIVLEGEVMGVFPDFHFASLRNEIKPLVMSYPRTRLQDIYIRFESGIRADQLLPTVQLDWKKIVPEFPFDYEFLSVHLQSMYQSEKFFSILFRAFAAVAIIISCLGLFAIVSQEIVFKVKEIGIRKVLGANVGQIVVLISKPFGLLIILANVVAWPATWTGMNQWLNEFSYHISLSWAAFAIGGLLTLLIAFVTIVGKTTQAGRANPVDSIRTE